MKKIVFPENDPRILKAVYEIAKKKIAIPILLENEKNIIKKSKKIGIDYSNFLGKYIICADKNDKFLFKKYLKAMYKIRKEKGWSLKKCRKKLQENIYYGTMMVEQGDADALISGTIHNTAKTILPGLELVKKKKHKASAVYLVTPHTLKDKSGLKLIKNKTLVVGDVAININPNEKELAQIAIDAGDYAKKIGIKPKVAMLSFSSCGSSNHEYAKKVRNATNIASKKRDYIIEGELQFDAAINPRIAKIKCPNSKLKGKANVLIFPGLESANIGCKIMKHICGYKLLGPITLGLEKSINDLSRGCTVEEIIASAILIKKFG